MSGLNTFFWTQISAAHVHRAAVHTKVEQAQGSRRHAIDQFAAVQGAAQPSEQNVPEVGNACKVTKQPVDITRDPSTAALCI